MSEPLLKAILRLFVIVAKEDDITESERAKVKEFLLQHLNKINAQKYLDYFDKIGAEALSNNQIKTDVAEMQELLKTMFRQLPGKTEMDKLLVDVSQTALGAGIDVQLFQPNTETKHDFYAERPISVRMLGDYHQFGEFVSGVAALPRVVILTMHDISLRRADGRQDIGVKSGDGRLILEGNVKTYRYIDEEEAAARAQQGKAK